MSLKNKNTHILLYPCNIVGYIRLVMLIMAVVTVVLYNYLNWHIGLGLRFGLAIWLFFCLLILDMVDGYLARKLNHTSNFGSLFELTLDLLTHTFVWSISGLTGAMLLVALDWTSGLYIAAFSLAPDKGWKNLLVEKGPWLVRVYWQSKKINVLNDYCNLAHFAFPMSLFVFGSVTWFSYMMLPGLIIFELVSIYMIYIFIKVLIAD